MLHVTSLLASQSSLALPVSHIPCRARTIQLTPLQISSTALFLLHLNPTYHSTWSSALRLLTRLHPVCHMRQQPSHNVLVVVKQGRSRVSATTQGGNVGSKARPRRARGAGVNVIRWSEHDRVLNIVCPPVFMYSRCRSCDQNQVIMAPGLML